MRVDPAICEQYPNPSTRLRRSKSQSANYCQILISSIPRIRESRRADDIVRDAAAAAAAAFPIAEAVCPGAADSCPRVIDN